MDNFVILPIPLYTKDIKTFDYPGVYFFIKEPVDQVLKYFQEENNDKFLNKCSIFYIGKAKKIKQRLLSYKIFIRRSSKKILDNPEYALNALTDQFFEEKKSRLGTSCKCLVIKKLSSHFEACFEEINYIKYYLPIFNTQLKSKPKPGFIKASINSIKLEHKKNTKIERNVISILRNNKKIRLNFSYLISIIKVLEKNLSLIFYKYESFGKKIQHTYIQHYPFIINTDFKFSYCLQDEILNLLKGKKNKISEHIYLEMFKMSNFERYTEAADLRDIYFHLKSLQKVINKSRRFWRKYRKGKFFVRGETDNTGKIFVFNYRDSKSFIENYEKISLVYLWIKNNWEQCHWEILTKKDKNITEFVT